MDAGLILYQILADRPVAYHPDLGRALGSAQAGVFLSQMLYWQGKGKDPDWIWKTQEEMERETALSRREQDTCRRVLRERGILEERRAGVPARMHYKLDFKALVTLLSDFYSKGDFTPSDPVAPKRQSRLAESANLVAPKRQSKKAESAKLDARNRQTRLAESANPFISEITAESTQRVSQKKLVPEIAVLRSVLSDLPERTVRALADTLEGAPEELASNHKLARAYDIYLRRTRTVGGKGQAVPSRSGRTTA